MNLLAIQPKVDVEFRIAGAGKAISLDHSHQLFGALSKALNEDLHNASWLGIHVIRGDQINDEIVLNRESKIKLRVDIDKINLILKLAGKIITIGKERVVLSSSNIIPILPSLNLHARMVVIKPYIERQSFIVAAIKQLKEHYDIELPQSNIIVNEKRKLVKVHDKKIVGYGVTLLNLSDTQSALIQTFGLGGKRRMGCGLFTPTTVHK